MGAQRKYDQQTRERAVRMYRDRLEDEASESKLGARRHVGELLGIQQATIRNWVEESERAEGTRGAAPSRAQADTEEVRALKKRVAELERANEILKTASAFFAQAELDRRLK
jgi:transposase-like protein